MRPSLKIRQDDRRAHILDAAERCFVRAGFHRSTMQDVAHEAAMSPGNLYRYFASKEALIEGLCARDRARVLAEFAALGGAAPSLELLEQFGRRELIDEPRGNAILAVEIWSEATRNPYIARVLRECEADIRHHLVGFMRQLQQARLMPAERSAEQVADLLMMLVNGYYQRRATDAGCDAPALAEQVFAVMRLAMGVSKPYETHAPHEDLSVR